MEIDYDNFPGLGKKVKPIRKKKNTSDRDFIVSSMKKHFIFSNLSNSQL